MIFRVNLEVTVTEEQVEKLRSMYKKKEALSLEEAAQRVGIQLIKDATGLPSENKHISICVNPVADRHKEVPF